MPLCHLESPHVKNPSVLQPNLLNGCIFLPSKVVLNLVDSLKFLEMW